MSTEPQRFELPCPKELLRKNFNVFPDALENDELVFFHATSDENYESILATGIQTGIKAGAELSTISFTGQSVGSFHHWVTVRNGRAGVILALRFENRDELSLEGGTYYSRDLVNQPEIIAVCIVPASYEHR